MEEEIINLIITLQQNLNCVNCKCFNENNNLCSICNKTDEISLNYIKQYKIDKQNIIQKYNPS